MANRHQTTTLALILGLCPGLSAGCYSGLDQAPKGGGAGGQADDGADGDQAGEDDGTPQDPTPEDPQAPFRVPTNEARLLPFPVRMANLTQLTGQGLEHPMYLELLELRFQLGDHDFASGVAPDLRWSSEKMQYWVRGLKPVCQSAEIQQAYPDLLTDPRPLMRQAWGHEPTADEVEALADLQGGQLTPEEQQTVTCIAVLTALDFVSI